MAAAAPAGLRAGGLPRRKPRARELPLHIAAASFMARALPEGVLWSHFPAGEKRDGRAASKLKAMGLKPGWPDFILVLPDGRAGFIELKAKGGSLSPDQKAFEKSAKALGARHAECRSLEEVEYALSRWLQPHGLVLRVRIAA
jgi:hypothetical protein